jgi:hypothetical protein
VSNRFNFNLLPHGEMWYCGDDVCDCHQPIIERARDDEETAKTGDRFERVWSGEFHSTPTVQELQSMWKSLKDECSKRNVPILCFDDCEKMYG